MEEKICKKILDKVGENAEKKIKDYLNINRTFLPVSVNNLIFILAIYIGSVAYVYANLGKIGLFNFLELIWCIFIVALWVAVRITKLFWLGHLFLVSSMYFYTLFAYISSFFSLQFTAKFSYGIVLIFYIVIYILLYAYEGHKTVERIKMEKLNSREANNSIIVFIAFISVTVIVRYCVNLDNQMLIWNLYNFVIGVMGALLIPIFFKTLFIRKYYPEKKL